MSLISKTPLKDSRKKSPIAAAELERVMERAALTQEPYAGKWLYPSILYELDIKQFVLDFYAPVGSTEPWKKLMYTSHGKAAERIIQDHLFRAGVLDCPHPTFQETTVFDPDVGISGRADGILLMEKLKHLGSVKVPEEQYTGESERVILEIKETSSYQYSMIRDAGDVPMKFKWAQCAYQNILDIPKSCFLYINRDSMSLKTVFFESKPEMWQEILDRAKQVWYYVHNRLIPTEEGDISLDEYFH